MKRGVLLVLAALAGSAGCGRYAEFRLPEAGAGAGERRWTWTAENNPQIARGDQVDVLNPVVVEHAGQYWNFYSAFDGKTWHTALATSADGKGWTKVSGKVLSPDPATWEGNYIAANGDVVRVKDEFWMWYQAGPMGKTRIGLAKSKDGRTWVKHPEPVLEQGPRGAWDEISLGDADVYESGGVLYLFYLGEDRARRQRLGVARSTDGIRWEKLRGNPVLELGKPGEFDEQGLGEPNVWRPGAGKGEYWMLYTGRDRKEIRRMGLARSRDGVKWEKVSEPVIAGQQWWNNKVVCDGSVIANSDAVRVWYGGGTVAHPAERINGQIGYGELRLAAAAVAKQP
jgi:predicted GH43/DUF377 family glycosyl hydrolase